MNEGKHRSGGLWGAVAFGMGIALTLTGLAHAGSLGRAVGHLGTDPGTIAGQLLEPDSRHRIAKDTAHRTIELFKDEDTGKFAVPQTRLGPVHTRSTTPSEVFHAVVDIDAVGRAGANAGRVIEYVFKP